MTVAQALTAGQKKKLRVCYNAIEQKKGEEVVLLDLRGVSGIADFFIVCHGGSTRQVSAISDNVEKALKDAGFKRCRTEGRGESTWVLMDAGDVVAHVFHKETREFYGLENLWVDAPKIGTEELADEDGS